MDDEDVVHAMERFMQSRTTRCTEAFSAFLSEYRANVGFFFFITRVVSHADDNRVTAAKALLPVAVNKEQRECQSASKKDPLSACKRDPLRRAA